MQIAFENCSLDTDRRELRRDSELVSVEPQVFDLLVLLIEHRDRVVSKDDLIASIWGGRIVSDSTLDSRINAARKAIGDTGKEQRLIRTISRKGIRFVGEVHEGVAPRAGPQEEAVAEGSAAAHALRQEVHFCKTADGVRIAYAEVGEGPPLLKAANWTNHLEFDWKSPVWSEFLRTFALHHRLIRYDSRGNGLSDWEVDEISFEAFVRDLECVVDAAGVERFPLLGVSQGAAISIAYAVRHPERVSHLVIYGGFARGRRKRGSPEELAKSDAVLTLMREGWGQENPAFRQLFTSLFIPGASPEQMQWYNDLQRMTTSPENAVRLRLTVDDIDVSALLPLVQTPTLVLHCRDDAVQPFEEGRQLAAGIKGAHFVALEGRNHLILKTDPGWQRFFEEVNDFLSR